MSFQALDLTTALRPELLPDESVLFIQNAVGLYEGKYKLSHQQNGTAYLTSHRVCYVDNDAPRQHSAAIVLKDVERYEFYSGFLKSSPKITLWPKNSKRSSLQPSFPSVRSQNQSPVPRNGSPFSRPQPPGPSINWVCPICSFSNVLPPGFDPTTVHEQTPIPPCQTCGIKPPMKHLLKAAIAAASSARRDVTMPVESHRQGTPVSHLQNGRGNVPGIQATSKCPRCTFENHPSLSNCEMCGATLASRLAKNKVAASEGQPTAVRPESPGPIMEHDVVLEQEGPTAIKLSFRAGGEKIFYERLKGAMSQRKWLLVAAPSGGSHQLSSQYYATGDSNGSTPGSGTATPESRQRAVGIAGLERLTLEKRKNNEQVISGAFEDLEALMASAKEITALAESMAKQQNVAAGEDASAAAVLKESIQALGMTTTRDMLGGSDNIYLSELARTLAEYLTDDRRSVLKKEGGIIALVDLYARFNRANIGVEEVSPADFAKAARLWEKLSLPVRLRTFKNGLMVVQGSDRTDDKTVAQLLDWLENFRAIPPEVEPAWDWQALGRGVTAQEVAARFGWSVGVAIEELEMAEERGALCREECIEGLRFWENRFLALEREDVRGSGAVD